MVERLSGIRAHSGKTMN